MRVWRLWSLHQVHHLPLPCTATSCEGNLSMSSASDCATLSLFIRNKTCLPIRQQQLKSLSCVSVSVCRAVVLKVWGRAHFFFYSHAAMKGLRATGVKSYVWCFRLSRIATLDGCWAISYSIGGQTQHPLHHQRNKASVSYIVFHNWIVRVLL